MKIRLFILAGIQKAGAHHVGQPVSQGAEAKTQASLGGGASS